MNGTQHPVPVTARDPLEDDVRPFSEEEQAALYERVALMAYGLTALPGDARR
ncbi:hypothetical protein [Methyloversatilis discipulorum]|uniref:hypothetical protein n=1 Tax=Methyloversatilis discipulorum TaxID=1119528 RepID=UPI0012F7DA1D|nr:hypothetical protein [Methyloversatilis discipulorum]